MNKLLPAVLSLVLVAFARGAAVTPHSVLAHANDQQFFVARAERFNNEDYTVVYYRLIGQDDRWQQLCTIKAAVDEIAARGSLAAALMRDGSWALLYNDGNIVTAGSLPGSAQMVTLAGGNKNWWAIGWVEGGLAAAQASATREATTHSTTSTRPALLPATAEATVQSPRGPPGSPAMVLFRLAANAWIPIAQVPGELPENPHVVLSMVEDVPYVAWLDHEAIAVQHLDRSRWVEDLLASDLKQVAAFKLLGEVAPPQLWVQQQSGPDLIYALGARNAKPLTLNALADTPAKDRDVVLFGRSIRVIGRVNDKLIEQRFAAGGAMAAEDKPTPLAIPDSPQLLDLHGLQTLVALVSLMLVLLGWFRQQAASQNIVPNLDDVTLAPIRRRLAAGLIDVSPIILTMTFFVARHYALPSSVPQAREFLFLLAYWASGLFYVLHTTVLETLTGRSLGKIMFGLRVVTTQGHPASQTALFTRNALRIFDVSMFFLPILFVPFSPLRQRSGDLAAGTLVVTNAGGESESAKQERDSKDNA